MKAEPMQPSELSAGTQNINVYEKELNLSPDNSESVWVLIPGDVEEIIVTVEPLGGSSAIAYTTTDLAKKVKNEYPGVSSIEWTHGVIDNTVQDYCPKVTAVRFEQIRQVGTVKVTMRAQ